MTGRERVDIHRLTPDDAEALHQALSDPEVMRCVEPPYSLAETRAFIKRHGTGQAPDVCALVWRETGDVIGHVIFHPFGGAEAYEIGWILRRDYWGRGIADEVTALLIERAAALGVRRLVVECLPTQAATVYIAQKHGFAFEGERDGLCRFVRALPSPSENIDTQAGDAHEGE